MYAVIKTGGKQYRVEPGETIQVEKLEGNPGETLDLSEVLLVANDGKVILGKPFIDGALVRTEIVDHDRYRKVIIFKFKRRKRYRRKIGHRQWYTKLKVLDIGVPVDIVESAQPEASGE